MRKSDSPRLHTRSTHKEKKLKTPKVSSVSTQLLMTISANLINGIKDSFHARVMGDKITVTRLWTGICTNIFQLSTSGKVCAVFAEINEYSFLIIKLLRRLRRIHFAKNDTKG
jgi:hypothetical protein